MGEEAAVEEGWLEIQALRKEGRFSDAIDRGLALLEMHASDKRVRSQVDWAFHGQVKQMAGGIAARAQSSEPVARADIDALVNEVRRFARLPKRRPDRAVSLILLELARIAPHLPTFPGMVRWVGLDGLADEDWQYQKRNEREFSPIGLRVARGLAKWAKEHGDASPDDLTLTVSWLERARSVARGDDALWLDWDGASLYRRVNRGDDAATCLTHVVKAKQREFWVWAEASRLYSEARPDLAIACACRALECGADEKFLVKVHQELAVLLARGEAYAQASHEIAIAAGIRAKNGWKADATLRELVESAWYDPSSAQAEPAADFYASHSSQALVLCYDAVEQRPASFLGTFTPAAPRDGVPGRRPRPLARFAVRDAAGNSVSTVWPGMREGRPAVGAPVTLVVGKSEGDERETIVQMSSRASGVAFDCLDASAGVVVREAGGGRRGRIFISSERGEVEVDDSAWPEEAEMYEGDGARLFTTLNPKTQRLEIARVEPGPLPDRDVRVMRGQLNRNPKGFAFVGKTFVGPQLVASVPAEVTEVEIVAIYARHPSKDGLSWRAVSLRAATGPSTPAVATSPRVTAPEPPASYPHNAETEHDKQAPQQGGNAPHEQNLPEHPTSRTPP